MGGSAFPDRVTATLAAADLVPGGTLLLRSGCYVTHDHGTYAQVSPIAGLRPAVTIRAMVLSTPEPGMAVLGAGKRELPHDAGLPVVLSATDLAGVARPGVSGVATALFDHHLSSPARSGLRVTDVVELGISHPCSAFSRWDSYLVTRGGRPAGDGNDRVQPDLVRQPVGLGPGGRNSTSGPRVLTSVGALVSPGLISLPSWNTVRLEPCCAFRREATCAPATARPREQPLPGALSCPGALPFQGCCLFKGALSFPGRGPRAR